MLDYDKNKEHFRMGIEYLISIGYKDDEIYIPTARVTNSDIERKHKNFRDMLYNDDFVVVINLDKDGEVIYSNMDITYPNIDCKYNFYHFAGEPDLKTLKDNKYWEVKKFYSKENEIIFEREQVVFLTENLDSNIIIFSNDSKFVDVLQSKELLSEDCKYKIKIRPVNMNGLGIKLVRKVLDIEKEIIEMETYKNNIDLYTKKFKNIKVRTKIFNVKQNKWSFLFSNKKEVNTYICIGLSSDGKSVEHVWIIPNEGEVRGLSSLNMYNTCDSLFENSKYEVDSKQYNKTLNKINAKIRKEDKIDYEENIKKEKRKLHNLVKKEQQEKNSKKKKKIVEKKEIILSELSILESSRLRKEARRMNFDKYKGIIKESKKLDKEQFILNNFM